MPAPADGRRTAESRAVGAAGCVGHGSARLAWCGLPGVAVRLSDRVPVVWEDEPEPLSGSSARRGQGADADTTRRNWGRERDEVGDCAGSDTRLAGSPLQRVRPPMFSTLRSTTLSWSPAGSDIGIPRAEPIAAAALPHAAALHHRLHSSVLHRRQQLFHPESGQHAEQRSRRRHRKPPPPRHLPSHRCRRSTSPS